jgi:hypothetical protein
MREIKESSTDKGMVLSARLIPDMRIGKRSAFCCSQRSKGRPGDVTVVAANVHPEVHLLIMIGVLWS